MRLQAYILNEGRSRKISEDRAKDLLTSKCSDSLKAWKKNDGSYIFRGVDNINDYLRINSSVKKERMSANTTNEYTFLINHILSSWKKYPLRNIICSTSDKNAGHYGTTYNVFPVNGTRIGVCSNEDIWFSFRKSGILNLDNVNDFIFNLEAMNYNASELSSLVRRLTKDEVDKMDLIKFDLLPLDKWDEKDTFYTFLDNVLDPDANGFKLKKAGQSLPKGKEVWFNGEAVLITKHDPKEILMEL
jgi:hypothetical protein